MFEGLWIMRARDEGRHDLKRFTQDTIIRVVIGGVLTEILEGKGKLVMGNTLSESRTVRIAVW